MLCDVYVCLRSKNTSILDTHILPHKFIFYDEATNATQNVFHILFLLVQQFSIPCALFTAIYEDVRDIFMAW